MAGQKGLSPLCTFAWLVTFLVGAAFGAVEGLASCPPGKVCTREKCTSQVNGSQACCVCESWSPSGGCSLNGWRQKVGGGKCTLSDYPMTDMHLTKCPTGKKCSMSKCKGTGEEETCCKCAGWDEAGGCRDDSWTLVKGSGGCSVSPGDGSVVWIGEMLEQMQDKEMAKADGSSVGEGSVTESLESATILDHDAQNPGEQVSQTAIPATLENDQDLGNGAETAKNSSGDSSQASLPTPAAVELPPATVDTTIAPAEAEVNAENVGSPAPDSNSTEPVASPVEDEGSTAPTTGTDNSVSLNATTPGPQLPPSSKEAPSTDEPVELHSVHPSNKTDNATLTSTNTATDAPLPGEAESNTSDIQSPGAIKLDIPDFATPICPDDAECGSPVCEGKDEEQTCCVCNAWDQAGKCLPGKWEVQSGPGTCDFVASNLEMHKVPIAIPKRGSAAPEQFLDLLPFTPCPKGVTCETTKCAIRDGIEACCDCWVWSVNGRCSEKGWKPRGKGDCSFALS